MLIETTLPEALVRRLEDRLQMLHGMPAFAIRVQFRHGVPVGTKTEFDEGVSVDDDA